VKEVIISDDGTQADVIVPDHQLSLAIGKEGQNARLAARLTGVRIDIRGENQPIEGPDDADYEEGEWVENAEGVMEFRAADGSVVSAAEWNEQLTAEPAAVDGEQDATDPAPAAPDAVQAEAGATDTADTAETDTSDIAPTERGGDEATS
jgi:N utilization substance protein A